MPLFPDFGPTYYDTEDQYVRSFMEDFYYQANTLNQAQWTEGDTDARFYAGDQTVWNDYYGNIPINQRKTFNFNHTRPIVNMISGHQARNRKSTIVVPIENGDQVTADQYTKIMMWVNQQDNVLETISDAFKGALITGMNLLNVWVDYRRDPVSGDIKVDKCALNSILIDPFWRKADFSDCRAVWKRSFVTKKEAITLIPDRQEDIMSLPALDQRDGKFNFMPENFNYNMKNLLAYDEFYYKDYREQTVLIDPNTGESTEWYGNEDDLRKFMTFSPELVVQKTTVPTTKLALVVQGKVMYNGPQPLGIDEMPFVPITCYYMPDLAYYPWRLQGVVRGLRDAQYLYNRRKVIELDIVESNLNSGFFAKEDAVVNPRDLYKTGQGQVIWLKKTAQMTDIQQIQPSSVSPAMLELSERLSREMQTVSGVNDELMGSASDDIPGILSMVRQGAGLTSLQNIFDQLDLSQKLLGKIILKVTQNTFTPGKVSRIIGEQPQPQFYNKAFGQYDAAIEEGLNTTTQRQLQFAQMLQLKQVGVPITNEDLLEAATIQGKQKIIDNMLAQQQQQQQMQQQQAEAQNQIAMQDQQAKMQMAQARANADNASANERNSRIEENKALAFERMAEAEKDRDAGILSLVKAIKEIEQVDLAGLEKAIQIVTMIKNQTMPPQMSDLQQVDRGITLS